MNNNPRESLGHTSPESIPSIPSNPSSAGPAWASSISPDYVAFQQSNTDQNPFFPPFPVANPNVLQPYTSNEAPGPAAGGPSGSNKVAIPRLNAPPTHYAKRRSARACESCRQRKIKCDGNRPTCGQCMYHRAACSYEDVKRVRDQKQLEHLARRLENYETLLRGLESEADPPTARRIRKALRAKSGKSTRQPTDDSDSDSSVGSLNAVDLVGEDVNRNEATRAAGYFGKNSEVAWMQRLESDMEKSSSREQTGTGSPQVPLQWPRPSAFASKLPGDISMADMNYHLDDLPIPLIADVDPFDLPPLEIADQYFTTYMTYIHPTFSAIRQSVFNNQLRSIFTDPAPHLHRKWLAILNMILAIGCRYCQLLDPGNTTANREDLVFLTRARHLAFYEDVLFEHTDLQQAQLEFLVALYLLCLGQLNRASKFSSMALHSALSLGINLRFSDGRIQSASKESRCRLWWSIYSLEHLLTSMHGRASCVGESLCSVSLPIPAEEDMFKQPDIYRLLQDLALRDSRLRPTLFETSGQLRAGTAWASEFQPCPSLFFYYIVDLSMTAQAVLNKVFSIEGVREGTSEMEYRLQKYGLRLDRWLSKLPANYQFTVADGGPWLVDRVKLDESAFYSRERVCLALNYYSACVTLCRPCLSQAHTSPLGVSPAATQEMTSRAKRRTNMGSDCLQAACSLISILPESVDVTWLARIAPFWSILHFLMQATTALLLGISSCSFASPPKPAHKRSSFNQPPSPAGPSTANPPSPTLHYPPLLNTDLNTAIAQSKKALIWIHAMASIDASSKRAFHICDKVIRQIAPGLGIDLQDWPSKETLAEPEAEVDGSEMRMDAFDDLIDPDGGFPAGTF